MFGLKANAFQQETKRVGHMSNLSKGKLFT